MSTSPPASRRDYGNGRDRSSRGPSSNHRRSEADDDYRRSNTDRDRRDRDRDEPRQRSYGRDRPSSSSNRDEDSKYRRSRGEYGERERERERQQDRDRYTQGRDRDRDSRRSASPPSRSSRPRSRSPSKEVDEYKGKPNFAPSGLLAAATNTVRGTDGSSSVLKYNEPPEARKPVLGWRLYVFKGKEQLGESVVLV